MSGEARQRAIAIHESHWGTPASVARAPGRVNLIGEHTDYNDGFVLPMAIPFDTVIAISKAAEGAPTTIVSEGFGEAIIDPYEGSLRSDDWAIHIRGVHKLLREHGVDPGSWRAAIATDVPTGASLSSSAALEVALTVAILHLDDTMWSPSEIAKLCQRVENEVVGVPSGIMDQLISASATAGHASLIDCRSYEITPLPLPDGLTVAVMDTNTRRQLVDSEFADRRATCRRAADLLEVGSLRDAGLSDLDRLPAGADLERRRALHVITENRRTLDAAAAMTANDPQELGELMAASHRSLRDDYEVSGPALDTIVDIASAVPGCLGARMTGGGFAGCAVAVVKSTEIDSFCSTVKHAYSDKTGTEAAIWLCHPAVGGSIENL